jgi:hypothetical protein
VVRQEETNNRPLAVVGKAEALSNPGSPGLLKLIKTDQIFQDRMETPDPGLIWGLPFES